MTDCPCKECICVAVCKHKRFDDLIRDCKIVGNLLYYEDTGTRTRAFSKNVVEMKKALKAHTWNCIIEDDGFAKIWDVLNVANKTVLIGRPE